MSCWLYKDPSVPILWTHSEMVISTNILKPQYGASLSEARNVPTHLNLTNVLDFTVEQTEDCSYWSWICQPSLSELEDSTVDLHTTPSGRYWRKMGEGCSTICIPSLCCSPAFFSSPQEKMENASVPCIEKILHCLSSASSLGHFLWGREIVLVFANLTQTQVTWEEGVSVEELLPSRRQDRGVFTAVLLMAGGPGLCKLPRWAIYEKQESKLYSAVVSASVSASRLLIKFLNLHPQWWTVCCGSVNQFSLRWCFITAAEIKWRLPTPAAFIDFVFILSPFDSFQLSL